MIKFFRKIRQRLLTENKFSKYLLYAIGEIVLVVIGILIALQINNWNEFKRTKQFEYKILKDIQSSMEGNFFQLDMCIKANENSIKSANIILKVIKENLIYHDSLTVHFSRSLEWCTPSFQNAGYESLKSYGRNLITNDTIRESLGIYDTGWMEILGQRQEDFFYNTASPFLTELFDKVSMRTEMTPFDFEQLKNSKKYLSILQTSKAFREEQVYHYKGWQKSLERINESITSELKKNNQSITPEKINH
jgi:hypothetical protein